MWWSARFFEMLGLTPAEFEPTLEAYYGLMHPEDRAILQTQTDRFVASEGPFESEYRLRHASSAYRWFQARGLVFRDAEGRPTHMSGTVRDITEARAAADQVRMNEERLRSLAANVPGMIYQFEVSPAGEWSFPYLSEGARELFGVEPDVDNAGEALFLRTHPDDREMVMAAVARSQAHLTPYAVSHRVMKDTGEVRWVRARSVPHARNDGSVYWFGLALDITDQVQLEEQLRHVQKLEAIGNLAGGIAHDFNNILAGILGYACLAQEESTAQPAVREHVDEIVKAALRARDVVSQILTASRRAPPRRRPVRLQTVAREVADLMRSTLPASIRVTVRIEENCPLVMADASQLHQVLMNLCTNAFKAMQESAPSEDAGPTGELTVALAERALVDHPLTPAGPYAELRVDDTGPGIPADILERIFEPYFTTRRGFDGTGMGLAIVQGIVHAHGGRVDVVTTVGEGASFRVLLPVTQAALETAAAQPQASAAVLAAGQRVILVDDEPQVRQALSRALSNLGFVVEPFADAESALLRVREAPTDVDIVVTDLTMPTMSGTELTRQIRQTSPNLPVIVCSGLADERLRARAAELGVRDFILKPIAPRELAQRLLAALVPAASGEPSPPAKPGVRRV